MTSLCYSITLANSRFSCIRCAGFCWMGDRVGSGPTGFPGILPKTPFSCVPIYPAHVPLIFGDSTAYS